MKTRKPSEAEPTFIAHAHRLSDGARQVLRELLGVLPSDTSEQCEAQDLALLDVEQWLGFQPVAEKHVDHAPYPSDYVAKFDPMWKSAESLLENITKISGYYSEALTKRGVDLNEAEQVLFKLTNAAYKAAEEYKAIPNPKGARKSTALKKTVLELRLAFQKGYRGENSPREKQGAFETLSPREQSERAFVEVALRDARLIPKSYTGLAAFFHDPECALPSERAKTIERIAKKAQRKK
jgi:hypothetical protein